MTGPELLLLLIWQRPLPTFIPQFYSHVTVVFLVRGFNLPKGKAPWTPH
jgi:hypothetical protein